MEILVFLFNGITALDAIGPYEVLSRLPGAHLRFVAPEPGMVRTDNQLLSLCAELGIDDARAADLLLVPGGYGTRRLERDLAVLEWLRDVDVSTRITASVCTGSLLLAAAGLLRDRRTCTHWAQRERLREHGAIAVTERWARDGKYATAAGVSAGIDLALALAEELCGRDVAEAIQLQLEYAPVPPRDAGTPERARPEIREAVLARIAARDAKLESEP